MNLVREEDGRHGGGVGSGGEHAMEIGTDERRMHVRAYNYWVSLLNGRAYPSIEDLDPANIADFGPNSVLLDFSLGIEDPAIQFLGRSLREECGVDASIRNISEVPGRSLLSRLTDHYLQIIANRAPIGFEAEFVSQRGHNTLYRGILMPFSSDDDTIDFIYGVINWKETVDAETQARLNAEIEAARRELPRAHPAAPAWADGPSGGFDETSPATQPEASIEEAISLDEHAGIYDLLDRARESAERVADCDSRSRAALYRALGCAYAFADAADAQPECYAELLTDAGLTAQARAPMTPIVKLVFGIGYDKTRLTEFATVLAHARRHHVPVADFPDFLAMAKGGIKGIVAAERAERRPAKRPDSLEAAAQTIRARAPIAQVPIAAGDEEFVLLLARAGLNGMLDIVARVDGNAGLTEKAVRRVGSA
ncbi:PAS domain-containing protein [Sphingomonas sp.]